MQPLIPLFRSFHSLLSPMVATLIAFASLLPAVAFALNDWSVPCLQGQCAYDLSSGGASGSMMIVSPLESRRFVDADALANSRAHLARYRTSLLPLGGPSLIAIRMSRRKTFVWFARVIPHRARILTAVALSAPSYACRTQYVG